MAPPAAKPAAKGAAGTLSGTLAAAQVKRCPKCQSDSLAAPSDLKEVGGRVVFQDSQTYRGHWWYADTGELYVPPAAAPSPAPGPTAKPAPAAQPSA